MATKQEIIDLKKCIQAIQQDIGKFDNSDIQSIMQMLSGLKNSMESIEQRMSSMEEQMKNSKREESPEEKERGRSLVLIGLPESTKVRPTERAKDDQEAVERVLDELGVECLPVATYRMGKPPNPAASGSRNRLVKVVLPSSTHQHIALGQWKKHRDQMRGMEHWRRLLIRPSLTKEKLMEDKARRENRWIERNKNTDENVTYRGKN